MIDLESMNQSLGLAWIKKKSLGEMTAHQKLTPAVHGKSIYNNQFGCVYCITVVTTSKTFLSLLNVTLSC